MKNTLSKILAIGFAFALAFTFSCSSGGGGGDSGTNPDGTVNVPSVLIGEWKGMGRTIEFTSDNKVNLFLAGTQDILPSSSLGSASGTVVYGSLMLLSLQETKDQAERGRFKYNISGDVINISNSSGSYSSYVPDGAYSKVAEPN